MFDDATRIKLQNIIQGTVIEAASDHCTTTRNFLCAGFSTSKTVKRDFESQLLIKKEQAVCLSEFASANNLWVTDLPSEELFLAEGGEAKVFFSADRLHVIKINDAGYYATWLEYFNSLVLHNLFFSETAYTFLGFLKTGDELRAVIRQRFIVADGQADLVDIKEFLAANGFENTRRQDYYNQKYGLILEDMHDENVLINSNTLFFIDTVFYTIDPASGKAIVGI